MFRFAPEQKSLNLQAKNSISLHYLAYLCISRKWEDTRRKFRLIIIDDDTSNDGMSKSRYVPR